MDCSPPDSCPWNSAGKNIGVDCHFLLQGIFLTQGLNLVITETCLLSVCLLRFLHLNIFVLPLQSRESWENVIGQVHVLHAVNWENCARPVFSGSPLHLVLEIGCSFPPGPGHTPLPRVSWPASWQVRESFPHLLFLTFLPLKIFSLPRCCVWGWHVLNPVSSREEPPLACYFSHPVSCRHPKRSFPPSYSLCFVPDGRNQCLGMVPNASPVWGAVFPVPQVEILNTCLIEPLWPCVWGFWSIMG